MNTSEIIEAIDQEILKLQQARALLADVPAIQATKPVAAKPATGKRRGRPKGSVNKKAEVVAPAAVKPAKRTLSAEGKGRIAAAQKARWAAQKKAAAKPVAKKIAPKPVAKKIAPKPAKKAVPAAKPAAKKIAAKVSKKRAVTVKKAAAEPVAEA
ncbi:hypothetical protein HDF16_005728 [Granulicella aggregans]|uniref:Uncharacterized protein n=1 Tax=Granulicella aggregans TaxID=474949 RepID=A0A7W8E6S8_9BACT|nr:hypothetical protein [Granulicella aggregans]MBB5060992.1 hypothetical protein [Granulicella aggregans]